MKKIIFLVDTKDSRFLIINNHNNWELPSISIKEKFADKNFLCEKYQKKYGHSIRDIIVVEDKDKYVFVKCMIDTKLADSKKYKNGVINEIMPLITNEFHNQFQNSFYQKYFFQNFQKLNSNFSMHYIYHKYF